MSLKNFLTLEKQPPEVFYKKGALQNFAIFKGKLLCWSAFEGLQVFNFIKKDTNPYVFL